jgi:hypothetical protein
MEVLLAGVGRNVQNAGILRCFGSKTPLTLTPPFCSALGVELVSPTDDTTRQALHPKAVHRSYFKSFQHQPLRMHAGIDQ